MTYDNVTQCAEFGVYSKLNNKLPTGGKRKLKSIFASVASCVLSMSGAIAADFPERPINLVAPLNAGRGTDLLLRGLASHFEEAMGQNVFVSIMSGGSGTVAASALSGQKPTEYQMAYMSITVSTLQPQIKKAPYGLDSWTPICPIAASPTPLFVSNDSPNKTMDDVIAAANAEPGRCDFGS